MKKQGFTLIELLIVVAIIGIIAAIAIPNLLNAVQRAKQKRTMADIRSAATAWEARAVDANCYSAVCGATCTFPTEAQDGIFTMLSPTYIKSLPTKDGWQKSMDFTVDSTTAAQEYGIRAGGKDLTITETTDYTCGTKTTDFDCDIVYANGGFIQWPEGVQQ
ncbi:MAG TPA: prepilin-type N-terminal cleavage/methylation domain-containing protein [Thermoanaerobaculia bacterium]|nr:prepilin-type N-terminal cleavage/methylation domain-containing protein [Thermoanaerobaculia bacterium]HUM31045.1 prepilin-type N-terminal cleavage/methylation domain-containing protein [Thermoanaerobaculia bacterium]HXK69343.1 prepilin-type N-terminal cleavage/methylation domain-containing protein [Thermoanaerobaculia bacterium]